MPEDSGPNKRRRLLLGTAMAMQSIFLGRCLAASFPFNPRHLEAYEYGFWAMMLFAFAATRQTNLLRLIQPQWPIHISPQDASILANPSISTRTQPDGAARGVFVDLAVALVITKPRDELKNRSDGRSPPKSFSQKALDWLFTKELWENPELEPSFLNVWGLIAPLLIELKRGPPRHARNLFGFYKQLWQLLGAAKAQVKKQALTLYGSGRYRLQNRLYAVAAAGDYFAIAEITRSWADTQDAPPDDDNLDDGAPEDDSPPPHPSPSGQESRRDRALRLLQQYERRRPADITQDRQIIDQLWEDLFLEQDDDNDEYDDEGTRVSDLAAISKVRRIAEEKEAELLDAINRLAQLDDAADTRRSGRLQSKDRTRLENEVQAARRAFKEAAGAMARKIAPIQHDTVPLFLEDDLELYHRSRQDSNPLFFETRSPDQFFSARVQPAGKLRWSGVLRVGSPLAQRYLEYINGDIETQEDEEVQRRRGARFPL